MVLNNKLGFRHNYLHAIVFGPHSHGGIGCLDLRTEAGLGTLKKVIHNLWKPGHAQAIIMIFLKHWQQESGIPMSMLPTLKDICIIIFVIFWHNINYHYKSMVSTNLYLHKKMIDV